MNYLAQINIGKFEGLGPLGQEGCAAGGVCFDQFSASAKFELALSVAIGVMTITGGVWFLFVILSSAIQWITAGSDKQAVQNATKRIQNALIGLFLTVSSYGLILLVSKVLGFPILDPAQIIILLHP